MTSLIRKQSDTLKTRACPLHAPAPSGIFSKFGVLHLCSAIDSGRSAVPLIVPHGCDPSAKAINSLGPILATQALRGEIDKVVASAGLKPAEARTLSACGESHAQYTLSVGRSDGSQQRKHC